MPRAEGNDLCEIFGFAPDDRSEKARKQRKSQECPFVGGTCIKHSHPQDNQIVVYGSCSVVNKMRVGIEEVIICPQRLYADDYTVLKRCAIDAYGEIECFTVHQYGERKVTNNLPYRFVVMLGKNSGKEIKISNKEVISLSIDWALAYVEGGSICSIIPCEVQSIDITGNYRENWSAYSKELNEIPKSGHGMNWANVWKRLIPQLMLKSAISLTSNFCDKGVYFVIPDRVYVQFEKLLGEIPQCKTPEVGTLTVMTYSLGETCSHGEQRQLVPVRSLRMMRDDFAHAFGAGKQLPLGTQFDRKVLQVVENL